MRLRVLTWNIHKGIGGIDRRYRPERVIELLIHHGPDIVLLQEVDEGAKRSREHRQIDLIGDALGLRHRIYAPTHRLRSQGQYGNAILSRWPLTNINYLDLTIGQKKKRGAICARARVRSGSTTRSVVIYNLHLGLAGSERGKQLQRFLEHYPLPRLHRNTPLILGGDFNDLWGSLGKRYLQPKGFERAGLLQKTFPAWMPVRPLDAIFVRGDLRIENCAPSKLKVARQASDHLPLIANLHCYPGTRSHGH
jgi:endonuclease/exonuclease/phosphatase family metal-dependent hydrolase